VRHLEIFLVATLLMTIAHAQVMGQQLDVASVGNASDWLSYTLDRPEDLDTNWQVEANSLPRSIQVQFGPVGKRQCFVQGKRGLLEGWALILIAELERVETTERCKFRVGGHVQTVTTGGVLEVRAGDKSEKFRIVECSNVSLRICLIIER